MYRIRNKISILILFIFCFIPILYLAACAGGGEKPTIGDGKIGNIEVGNLVGEEDYFMVGYIFAKGFPQYASKANLICPLITLATTKQQLLDILNEKLAENKDDILGDPNVQNYLRAKLARVGIDIDLSNIIVSESAVGIKLAEAKVKLEFFCQGVASGMK